MAIRRWVGKALDIRQVSTITMSGVWLGAETITCTIGNKDLVLTIGTLVTTAQVATSVKQMLAGETLTDTTGSYNAPGNVLGEFREFVATVNAAVVTLTAVTYGKPFTMAVTQASAGGTATYAVATVATGKNFVDNSDNWDAALPADADEIILESGNVSILYGLAQSAISPTSIKVVSAYTGDVGLGVINVDDPSYPYPEYRDRYLQYGNVGDAQTLDILIGEGEGGGSQRMNIDGGTGRMTVNVLRTNSRKESGIPACCFKGSHASNAFNIFRGDVGIGVNGDSCTCATLRLGYINSRASDVTVYCGTGSGAITTLEQQGGMLTTQTGVTNGTLLAGDWTLLLGAVTTLLVGGNDDLAANFYYLGDSTITTLELRTNGTADFDRVQTAKTVTTCRMYKGSRLVDRFKKVTFTNDIEIVQGKITDVTLDIGSDIIVKRIS